MNKTYCILLLILLLTLLLASTFTNTAQATTLPWVRIVNADTPMYTNADTSKITCMLQYSYYLYVLDTLDQYYLVELMDNADGYPKILGYVAIDDVEQCTEYPLLPYYPQATVVVSTNSTAIRLSPLDSASQLIMATNAQTMSYYGYITSNDTLWYYVYFNGVFGYVDSSYVTLDNIDMHDTPLVEEVVETEDVLGNADNDILEDTTTSYTTTSEILLIIFVCVLSIVLVVALFVPRKHQPTASEQIWDKHL